MNTQNSIQLIGTDCLKPKRTCLIAADAFVLASSPGTKKTIKGKKDGNEDCLAIHKDRGGTLFAICDAHFGIASAKTTLKIIPSLVHLLNKNPALRLFKAHYTLDETIRAMNETAQTHSATTCIHAFHTENSLTWVSTGDSSLYIIRGNSILPLTSRMPPLFLGEFQSRIEQKYEEFHFTNGFYENKTLSIYFYFWMSHICSLANENRLDESTLSAILNELEAKSGVQFNGSLKSLTKPWHEVNTTTYRNIPEWGKTLTKDGDILLGITDGISDSYDSCEKLLDTMLNTLPDLTLTAKSLLAGSLEKGGLDNASVLMALL
ncbi:MAG: hypothetical protein CSA81_06915 [Acidobacteria bacterium]|nr:MAG: hypothetical protein CSA81_06915 [Acidobacteriota bacterium]